MESVLLRRQKFLWVSSLCPKVGEGGLGEKVRSGHLFGPWLLSLQAELPGVGVGTPAKWGLLGSRDVLGCGP